jgi:SNF2 family DNA or RNA helicase
MLKRLWKDFEYKPHQTVGINWMLAQEDDEEFLRGGFLCDEMGLGKTMEVLGVIKNSEKTETLVVCPLAVVSQWIGAAEKSKLNVYKLAKNRQSWECTVCDPKPTRKSIYITHYDAVKTRQYLIGDRVWNRMVFDEAHRLCNDRSSLHSNCLQLQGEIKWVVTATPIVNRLSDAMSLLAILGLREEQIPGSKAELKPIIRAKSLCRTVEELRSELPDLPKQERTYIHDLDFHTETEQEFYRSVHGPLVHKLNILMEEGSDQWQILKLMLVLRQLSIHPQVYINARKKESKAYLRDDWGQTATKFSVLRTLIETQSDSEHRWIVFCHFHDEMDILARFLRKLPRMRHIHKYSGKLSHEQRDEILQETKEPFSGDKTTDVLLIQLQSGSVGLNLQHFDRVAFLSPWWTAALMDQAVGRAVRIGQEKRVEVHHLRLKEEAVMNIDQLMIEKVESKRELCDWFLSKSSRGNLK